MSAPTSGTRASRRAQDRTGPFGEPVRPYMAANSTWSRELVHARLVEWAERFGTPPGHYDLDPHAARVLGLIGPQETVWEAEHPHWPSVRTVRTYCGSLSAVLVELDLAAVPVRVGTLPERVEAARRLTAAGLRSAEIADQLGVSVSTVNAYLRATPCRSCGAPVTSGRTDRCAGCATAERFAAAPARTRDEIVQAIADWVTETGAIPGEMTWRRPRQPGAVTKWLEEWPRWPTTRQVIDEFGTFAAAHHAAGVRPLRRKRTRENVLEWLTTWRDAHPGQALPEDELHRLARDGDAPWNRTLRQLFGSYNAAMRAAGIPVSRHRATDQELVRHARALTAADGTAPTRRRWDASGPPLGSASAAARMGGWDALLRHTGVTDDDDAALLAPVEQVLAEGTTPTAAWWRTHHRAHPSYHTLTKRFGSWSAVLAAGRSHRP